MRVRLTLLDGTGTWEIEASALRNATIYTYPKHHISVNTTKGTFAVMASSMASAARAGGT